MSQHFLLTRQAKTLSLAQVFRMTDVEAETAFRAVRWPESLSEKSCSGQSSKEDHDGSGVEEGLR